MRDEKVGCNMVTAQYLLEGVMYSLEQCGVLLRDAVALLKTGANCSAIVLAAFAREELGRACILQDLRKEVIGGKPVTLEDIKNTCGDHVTKQAQGQLSIVQRASGDQGLAKLHRTRLENHPQSPDYKRADDQLNRLTKQQAKRTPDERHKLRMTSLYVEPSETGLDWNRPHQKTRPEAEAFLRDVTNDYAGQYDRFQNGFLEHDNPELFNSLQSWIGRPELLQPQWP